MINFDKDYIKSQLTINHIFDLLETLGGEPYFQNDEIIISATICHNPLGEGSHKLYYYDNSKYFKCFSGCVDSVFDIFELVIKVYDIQHHRKIDLNDAVRYVAAQFGFYDEVELSDEDDILDWEIFENYNRIQNIQLKNYDVQLKEYDNVILDRLNYNLKINPWLNDNISQESMEIARIGYFPGMDQISIPHFDKDNRFVGLRGRAIAQEDIDRFGKYRPMIIDRQQYNHPLSMNLYNLNISKGPISILKKAIIFESEKSCMQYRSYFGIDNDISVACCGSNISSYQMNLLLTSGAEEIIIGMDRQFQKLNDNEFKMLVSKLKKINEKYRKDVNISFLFDKDMITAYKASPTDEGPNKFMQLFNKRIVL